MKAQAPAAGREAAQSGLAAAVLSVVAFAALLRWIAHTGFFGSDEVTYVEAAFKVLDGNWTLDDYVGANRIGVNLPMAAFAALFGRNEFGAALYGLLCSLAEVALVTWAGWRWFGPRAGVAAGLLMAALPTHVHTAGRMLADAPLALLITASFVLFFEGERRQWPLGWRLAGAVAGLSFLVKPVTVFVFGILLAYPLVVRRWDWRWLSMAAGFALAMVANGLAYQALTGRFWYVFEVVGERRQSGYLESGTAAGEITGDPWMYPLYLFVKLWHTGLLGWLAAAALATLVLRARAAQGEVPNAARFVAFWGVGLVLILSLLPVSFRPLSFVPKQTNYMLMFVAPLALLAGGWLARLPVRWSVFCIAATVLVGAGFALLLQASVAVFTANSRATLDFVERQDRQPVHLMSNAYRASTFSRLTGGTDVTPRVRSIRDLARADDATERLVIIDEESFAWDDSAPFAKPSDVPACWVLAETLRGRPQGAGVALVRGIAASAGALPPSVGASLERRARQLSEPRPARVYRIPPGC